MLVSPFKGNTSFSEYAFLGGLLLHTHGVDDFPFLLSLTITPASPWHGEVSFCIAATVLNINFFWSRLPC